MNETVQAVVPRKKKQRKNGRTMSDKTVKLHEQRRKAYQKQKPDKATRTKWNKKIARSCRDDYRDWVTRWTEEIEKEERKGKIKCKG